MHGNDTVNLLG